MPDSLDKGGPSLLSEFSPREWSLRRKVALAVLIPMALAAVFGGLRVRNDLAEADSYSASADQVGVLRPAVGYLDAAAAAVVVARQKTAADDPDRDAAIEQVVAAADDFEEAVADAGLTAAQRDQAQAVLDRSAQLREPVGYASINQSVSQLTQLQSGVIALIDTVVQEQREPELRLQLLGSVIDGRVSLALQQFAVAYNKGQGVTPVELAAEVGVEAAAIDRIAAVLGTTDTDVAELRAQNAAHFGTVRDGGTDLGDATAYAAYDRLTTRILEGIDETLAQAADESESNALVNSVITLAALLAAIFLALLVSRLLLDPIRRVRDGALEVAHTRLPEAVQAIRSGEDPGEIVPIDVTTHEEMGQLARAVDNLHQEAVNLAAGEAKVRQQVGEMFVTLSRRSTSLINQQLGLIEKLEKDEEDPKRLESLFRLDHLASRMRRTAESLNVLADAPVGTTDPHGLSVGDVLQAALAGVQEYQRVQIESDVPERVAGVASSDTVHLVTELIDNALAYSPPTSTVTVTTTPARGGGVVIEVSDAGLGMKDDAMEALNRDLRSGGEINAETARRMGLLVVSRIAKRHGIFVELERNDRGGVTAAVLLPAPILRLPGESPRSAQPVAPVLPTRQSSALAAFTGTEQPPAVVPVPDLPAPAVVAVQPEPEPVEEPAAEARPEPVDEPAAGPDAEPDVEPEPVEEPAAEAPPEPVDEPVDEPAAGPEAEPDVEPAAEPAAEVSPEPVEKPAAEARPVLPASPAPPLPMRRAGDPPVPAGGLAARLQAMREAREAANLGGPAAATPAPKPSAPAATSAEPGSTDAIEAAINAVIRLPQRRPGAADVPEALTPISAEPVPPAPAEAETASAESPAAESPAAEAVPAESVPGPQAERIEPGEPEPIEEQVEIAEPEPESRPEPLPAVVSVSPIPTATTSFSVLDAGSPMPEPVPEDGSIFASLKSNWFNADGPDQPWTDSEVDSGWQAAERVAEATPLQVSESGLPVRRPGARIVPGGVTPPPAALVRDPEAIRARLAAHAAGVNRGRQLAGTPQAAEARAADPDSSDHSQEADPT